MRFNTLKVWDTNSGAILHKEITQFIGESFMSCGAISPDNRTFVAGEDSGQVHILRLEGVD